MQSPRDCRVNNTVQTLNLHCNNIGPDGAKAIGKALEVNTSLTELSLNGNQIGDDGAIAIGKALEGNKTLIKIGLGLIGIDGAKAIGAALEVNETLQTLSMASTLIEAQGAMCIAEALKCYCASVHSSSEDYSEQSYSVILTLTCFYLVLLRQRAQQL
eukprot:g8747.t1